MPTDQVTVEGDFSRGIIRDSPRTTIPPGGVYDATDYLLYQTGVAIKRGGTTYAGPAFGAGTYAQAVAYADFPAGAKLIGINNSGAFYTVAGSTTSLGGSTASTVDKPKLRIGGGKNLLVVPVSDGTTSPVYYDGSAAPAALGGSPPGGIACEIYKTRVVLGGSSATPQRMYFSPTPDITTTWDTTNSWIDTSYPVVGLAALSNALIILSSGHVERITGSTPPPGSDMTLYPLGAIGCTDARSIVIADNTCIYANPRGVFLTNGIAFSCLTKEGNIETYWQSLFSGYDSTTWVISAGLYRSTFLIISILDNNGALVACLMCALTKRAWWRLTNIRPMMFASRTTGQEELYYADRGAARINTMSGLFSPASGNKNDANGTAVTPTIEFRALGEGTGVKAFGFGRLTYYMPDAASDNPTMGLTVKTGIRAATSTTPAESPLAENTDVTRQRFSIAKDAQAVTVRLAQTNASAATEIYALEVESRSFPLEEEGVV